jgi:hypothetical protein
MGFHEIIAPDETTRFEGYAAELAAIQRSRAKNGEETRRALHVKQHIGVVGELDVNAPPHLRFGVFADAQTWPVYVRFSNGASMARGDKIPDVRGFAMKLVGVPGKKIIFGLEHEQTQDFLFINDASLPFRDPSEFLIFVRAAKDGPAKLLPRLLKGFGLLRSFAILRHLVKTPKVYSYALHAFHTAAPIAFGPSAAKLALFPLQKSNDPGSLTDTGLRDDLVRRLNMGPLVWSLRAQLFLDDEATPIEDTSVTWSGSWIELGTLTIPQQQVDSAKGREINELVEHLSFDPWHSLEAHRPLGAMMRARASAYRESVAGRNASAEPTSVLSL